MTRLLRSALLFVLSSTVAYGQATSDIFSQLDAIDNASPSAPIYISREGGKDAIVICSTENAATEYDTPVTRLARAVAAPCTMVGVTTFKGRGDPLLGDTLKYDPEKQTVSWSLQLERNKRWGGIAFPYSGPPGKALDAKLDKEQKDDVKALLPQSFGARITVTSIKGTRYTIAVNIGKLTPAVQSLLMATIPLPRDIAPDLLPNLDAKLYWVAKRPCNTCLFGGIDYLDDHSATFSSPTESSFVHHFVFASFVATRFVDRRTGSTTLLLKAIKSIWRNDGTSIPIGQRRS